MSSDEVVIRVENLSKHYHIYKAPQDRIKQFILPQLQRMFRRPESCLYQNFMALEGVSFEVRKGETFGVIGRNGAGKSTLLQLLCGTLNPTSGTAEINGRVAALLELGAGFNPEFSGRENTYMNATLLGLSREEIDERFDAILAFADIGEFIERPVKTYSSGMYVRLAFAVMAHVDADILVIDEALAVGDVFFTQKCMRFLRHFVEKGTLIFVTHDTNSVMSFCTKAVWLEAGRQKMLGDAKAVCEAYLEELYVTQDKPEERESGTTRPPVVDEEDYRDVRQDYFNASNLRNDLEVFRFSQEQASFGTSRVDVVNAYLADKFGRPLSWVVGGELVDLVIQACPQTDLQNPIVGFVVKDRLGQNLFGDNTYLRFMGTPIAWTAHSTYKAKFRFRMPTMPAGNYSVAVAIAEGTQAEHVVHAWIHDAIVFSSQSSAVASGLLGVPMLDVTFE